MEQITKIFSQGLKEGLGIQNNQCKERDNESSSIPQNFTRPTNAIRV